MDQRDVPDESTDDNRKSFQFVDLKRNAVRGPDSQRGDLTAVDFQNDTRRASWARSPTRTYRSGGEQGFMKLDRTMPEMKRDVFKDLLPPEMSRQFSPAGSELRSSFPLPYKRSEARSPSPQTLWSHSPPVVTPVGQRSTGMTPFGNVQETAWREQVDVWFQEADTNQDLRIDGNEAVTFFTRTGLASEELSKMWRYAVPYGEQFMNKTQFNNALKLVVVLQNGEELTSEIVSRAFSQSVPYPAPRITPLETLATRSEDPLFPIDDDASSSSSSDSAQQPRAYSLPAPPAGLGYDWNAAREAVPVSSALRTQEICLDVAYSTELADSINLDDIPAKACLVSVQVRLAPLRSKESAKPRKLIGVNRSLIAAPSLRGGLLQYFRIQDQPQGTADGRIKKLESEDVDSAFCSEVTPSHSNGKVTSMLVHEQSGYLFLGFSNAYIEMHHVGTEPILLGKCVNQWKAHKHGSIDAIAMTMWGDLWTGSSRGSIRIWQEPSAGKTPEGIAVKRPNGEKPHGIVKSIVVSSCGSVVWSAGQNNISIWESYSGSYLGRIETDKSPVQPLNNSMTPERNQRINTTKGLEVDAQGRIATAQKFGIRIATEMDDSDVDAGSAGLKVAVGRLGRMIHKGRKRIGKQLNGKNNHTHPNAWEEEITLSPIQGLAPMLDRTIWVGYKKGQLEKFSWNGQFKNRCVFKCGLSCLCVVDDRLWIGLNDGSITVVNSEFKQLKKWSAHEATVIDITILGQLVYSLAADGSIKGWSRGIPSELSDNMCYQKFMSCIKDVIVPHKFKILCGTWNVNQTRPPDASLRKWLCNHGRLEQCDIVILGLQEVEGTSSVARTMAIGKYSKSNSDKGSAVANWWANEFEVALGENSLLEMRWKRVALRQMSGIIIYVFARSAITKYIGNIGTAHVGTGVMGMGSNKGGVAVTFSLYRRRVTAVAAHFAAHKDNVAKRKADYQSISKGLQFEKERDSLAIPSPQAMKNVITPKNSYCDDDQFDPLKALEKEVGETEVSSGLQQAELLVWLGDFNYRVETSYENALELIKQDKGLVMLALDQCRAQMKEKQVFVGLREGRIQFNPTYKFDKGPSGGYDSSEKKRVPAWTDRIFFRGSKPFDGIDEEDDLPMMTEEPEPLISFDSQQLSFVERASSASHDADAIVVSCEAYDACMDVSDSDHKPVWSLLNVSFPAFIQEKMRNLSFNVLQKDLNESLPKIGLNVSAKFLEFVGDGQKTVELQNRSETAVKVTIFTEEAENANRHLPGWLDILPRTFLLAANCAEKTLITVSQKGAGRRLHSQKKLYRKLILRAEGVPFDWRNFPRDYEVGVLLHAT